MTLRKLIYWFFSTLILGCVTAIILGFLFEQAAGEVLFGSLTSQLLLGLTLAAVAELGFFAYLVFNWLAKGLLRKKTVYDTVMLLLILILTGNLLYLNFAKYQGEEFWLHLLVPTVIVLSAILIAGLKQKWTNQSAYIPTLFFVIAATTIEAIPSINPKEGEVPLLIIMHTVLVLLVCNAWQILQLHRWVQPSPAERGKKGKFAKSTKAGVKNTHKQKKKK
ncbi:MULTISPECIES: KinB-signaling pathway activation protein [Thermoactinomyces]|jgi:KinB signaling pathway activation protein|uniref:KinB-signaling pathway activation protein n=1 Tax=Thermoactinomyces vulgaris TaxID=2026 RepID=A0ABS0QKF5_THEVU|nr:MULTISPECIES: KinB-signaling pathway activation protein [Thermoactinomyces]MBA4552339.1 KinB-signaling pathway activation protein [Thermoactinomyces vulgaris]MBA4596706.1 KinB-signaling pathway activation protein [Thermoactinomyces vulgaris]MBH8586771.1 KinB-signaling pathway activation protein [Thermoactinomyces sp. CICC 10520]MBH8589458.1 KinB-signaling pathway activation protein [Thermoactinomyces vulgaris]RMA99893.1 KinB signaling pathway activation protein [Thermoactinomyces vulgaris]